MKIEELITKQQLEIENLKQELNSALEDKRSIVLLLTCIGGGLNDNKLGYTKQQQAELFRILHLAENNDTGKE